MPRGYKKTVFEIWDNKTGNVVDEFADEEEALAFVRETVTLHGPAAVATWSLDAGDRATAPVTGRALLRRALVGASA